MNPTHSIDFQTQWLFHAHTGSVKIIKKHDKNVDNGVSSLLLPQLYALPFITSRTAALVETQLEVWTHFSLDLV
jgi:hypothetical protein